MAQDSPPELEGWYKRSTKWHYMRAGHSLCGRWGLSAPLRPYEIEPFDPAEPAPGPDDCPDCWRQRMAEAKRHA